MKTIFSSLAAVVIIFGLAGCTHIQLHDGADKVQVVEVAPESCIKLDESDLDAAPIECLNPGTARENLILKARNKAAVMGADKILVSKHDHGFGNVGVAVDFYSCGPVSGLSDKSLVKSCDLDEPEACAAIATREQTKGHHAKMLAYFRKACALNQKSSCDWLGNFEKQKATLKSACIARDADSCFSAAKLADVETDFTLMMTFLKQGCSYGHSESCFYQNYAQEEKERIRDAGENRYMQYMANMQAESLRQQRFMATMAMLNYQSQVAAARTQAAPKSVQCVSRKSGTSVVTDCN
jgi:hypothetical protein